MEWVIGIVLTFLSLLGIGKLLEMAYKARQERKAVQRALDVSNAGKEIDADVNAFNSISKRLELVESRLDEVHAQLMDQKVENAKLEAENVRLSKDNERQEKEIERQRARLHKLAEDLQIRDGQIISLNQSLSNYQQSIDTLRSELHATTVELNRMKQKIEGNATTG